MKESAVRGYIEKWLKTRWKESMQFGESNVDFLVFQWPATFSGMWIVEFEQTECKGTKSNVHRAIGQCLDYYFRNDCIPTYLAVPEDYNQLKTLEKLMVFFDLPIGMLLVNNKGEISVKRETKGKTRCYKLFEKESGTLTTKSRHPKLHYPQ